MDIHNMSEDDQDEAVLRGVCLVAACISIAGNGASVTPILRRAEKFKEYIVTGEGV